MKSSESFDHRRAADSVVRHLMAAYPAAHVTGLASALAASATDLACYEASVRGGAETAIRAGRMMVERAAPELFEVIATSLDITPPTDAARWLELAQRESVPLITGWDLRGGGGERCAKLYVNASDVSQSTRQRLTEALLRGVRCALEPAVIGMNARADGIVETKVYVQEADAVQLASGTTTAAESLAANARAEGAAAGGVLSYDANRGDLQPRAFFVALREPSDAAGWRCLHTFPGYDERRIETLLPFSPAPPRSAGVSLSDSSWTVYYKPCDSGRAPEALEPMAIFRLDGAEVGVFVEPTERAERAFRRTERHAVSVRIRDGKPAPIALESLVDWFSARLQVAESECGNTPPAPRLHDPPSPWHLVGTKNSEGATL